MLVSLFFFDDSVSSIWKLIIMLSGVVRAMLFKFSKTGSAYYTIQKGLKPLCFWMILLGFCFVFQPSAVTWLVSDVEPPSHFF